MPNSLKKIERVHSFKKALIDFYVPNTFSLLDFYYLITSYSQLLIVLFTVLNRNFSDFSTYIFNCDC